MEHPFEQRQNILWLAALIAGLAVYFFLAIPNGPVPMVKVQAAAAAAVQAVPSDLAAVSHPPVQKGANSVPLEGLIIAITFGTIALIASLSPFMTALSRRKTVQWVGPRSR